jgi:hypothetical protein
MADTTTTSKIVANEERAGMQLDERCRWLA